MNKTERIEKKVRMVSREILASSHTDAIFTRVIIEDITVSGEKWCLKELIKKYEAAVEELKGLDMDNALELKMVECFNGRLAQLEGFKKRERECWK